jgi:catechol 2,3-dioxygenase-like lactoylglutathione lyase family enzyme
MTGGEVRELRVALTVDDYDEAVGFYREALGMPQLEAWEAPEGRVAILDAGRATLELLDAGQAALVDEIEVGRRVAGTVRLALEVDDSEAVAERLVRAGAEQLADAVVTPWRDRNVRLQAPDGMQLTLFTVPDEPAGLPA